MIYKVFAFLLIVAVGIIPVSISHNDGVNIHIDIEEPEDTIRYGDDVVLRCSVSGLYRPYVIHWEYMIPDNTGITQWEKLNCTGPTYKFVLTEENANYCYRVVVTCSDDKYIASGFGTPTDLETDK